MITHSSRAYGLATELLFALQLLSVCFRPDMIYGVEYALKLNYLLLLSVERPRSSNLLFLSLMVRGGYACVAITHRTLKWTTGSLSCAQMLMHAVAHGGVRTPKESLH